jgi:site-specific DNA-cytosine methylase
VFFCAIRNDIEAPKLQLAPKHKWVTAGEATEDLQVLTVEEKEECKAASHYFQYWSKTKPGKVSENGEGKSGVFYGIRLGKHEPARSLVAGCLNQTFHWDNFRLMTYREWKRLGSFPDDYQAKTPQIGKYMIGMSVPPRMTEAVARAVIEQWLLPKPAAEG